MFSGNDFSLSDIAAVTGSNRNDDGFFGGNGLWLILFFILILGGGWGFGGFGGNGAVEAAVTSADLQRSFDNSAVESKLDTISSGLCNGFNSTQMAMAAGFTDVVGNINATTYALQNAIQANAIADMQNNFALTSQLQNCCCENRSQIADLKYTMATDDCATNTLINTSTRDLIENNNANTRAILEALNAQTLAQKDEKIHELTSQVNALGLAASQQVQSNYIVDQLRTKAPIPAYVVANPYSGACSCASYGCMA